MPCVSVVSALFVASVVLPMNAVSLLSRSGEAFFARQMQYKSSVEALTSEQSFAAAAAAAAVMSEATAVSLAETAALTSESGPAFSHLDKQPINTSYTKLGIGRCVGGLYSGGAPSDAMDARACATKCSQEPQCRFFSFIPGAACSRFNESAGNCTDRPSDSFEYVSFRREMEHLGTVNGTFGEWQAWSELVAVPNSRLVFCALPKSACTQWKQLVLRANGVVHWNTTDARQIHDPVASNLALIGVAHGRQSRDPDAQSMEEISRVFNSPVPWTKAVMVRDPISRLLSTYLDRCVDMGEWHRCKAPGPIPFAEAVINIERDRDNSDVHFRRQVDMCGLKYVKYDLVGRQEEFVKDSRRILQETGLWERFGQTGWGKYGNASFGAEEQATSNHAEEHNTAGKVCRFYSRDLLAVVYRLYEADFVTFGYNISYWGDKCNETWQKREAPVAFVQAANVSRAKAAEAINSNAAERSVAALPHWARDNKANRLAKDVCRGPLFVATKAGNSRGVSFSTSAPSCVGNSSNVTYNLSSIDNISSNNSNNFSFNTFSGLNASFDSSNDSNVSTSLTTSIFPNSSTSSFDVSNSSDASNLSSMNATTFSPPSLALLALASSLSSIPASTSLPSDATLDSSSECRPSFAELAAMPRPSPTGKRVPMPLFYLHEGENFTGFEEATRCFLSVSGVHASSLDFDDRLRPFVAEHMTELWLLRRLRGHAQRTKDITKARVHIIAAPILTSRMASARGCDFDEDSQRGPGFGHARRLVELQRHIEAMHSFEATKGHDIFLAMTHGEVQNIFTSRFLDFINRSNIVIGTGDIHNKAWEIYSGVRRITLPRKAHYITESEAWRGIDAEEKPRDVSILYHGYSEGATRIHEGLLTVTQNFENASIHLEESQSAKIASVVSATAATAVAFSRSRFCPVHGDSTISRQLFDALAGGCVPIVIGNFSLIKTALPFPSSVDWSRLALFAGTFQCAVSHAESTRTWLEELIDDNHIWDEACVRERGREQFINTFSYMHGSGLVDAMLRELVVGGFLQLPPS
eukprot:TRINITY_DN74475_c0_g1_i1.p1 TRINITY_DN74475_c0_g1~~TRINITY_DN74475_c0_g1_i1.p1  ORF type:complete len:1065 (+),score=162.09 TRINITY_DN74475_c0_g1_i1:83-3196(+)